MASTDALGQAARRRPAPPPATGPSSRRLPAGTPIPPGVRRDTPNSHIQIIPRPPDSDITYFADAENDAPVPIRTNQSYVVEAEAVVLRGAPTQTHQRQTSGHTFADMARAGVGVEAYKNELMASNEPQPLGNYLKFTKPKPGKGFDKQKSITADASRKFPCPAFYRSCPTNYQLSKPPALPLQTKTSLIPRSETCRWTTSAIVCTSFPLFRHDFH